MHQNILLGFLPFAGDCVGDVKIDWASDSLTTISFKQLKLLNKKVSIFRILPCAIARVLGREPKGEPKGEASFIRLVCSNLTTQQLSLPRN